MGYIGNTTTKYFINEDTTFYISTNGVDTEYGGSYSNPWKSLSYAMNILKKYVWDVRRTNITLHINQGTYPLGSDTINLNHMCGSSLTIEGDPTSGSTILTQSNGVDGFSITGNHFIKLKDLTIVGPGLEPSGKCGIIMDTKPGILLSNITISDYYYGIYLRSGSLIKKINGTSLKIKNCYRHLSVLHKSTAFVPGIITRNGHIALLCQYNSVSDLTSCDIKDGDYIGIYVTYMSTVYATSGSIIDVGERGFNISHNARLFAHYITITNNSVYCGGRVDVFSFADLRYATVDHNGVGGDATYGLYAIRDSYIDVVGDTMDSSGHITTDYDPVPTSSNDPTFDNRASWIRDT